VKVLVVAAAVIALQGAVPEQSVQYVLGRQQPDGGFAEVGRSATGGSTAWAVLGLASTGKQPTKALEAAAFLARQETPSATDLELTTLALVALGHPVDGLADRIQGLARPDGRIGALANSTMWGVIALRAAKRPIRGATVKWLLDHQARSGGWAWAVGGTPDADDTAVAIQALRAAGVSPRRLPILRALGYLRTTHRPDGGYAQMPGGRSNAQTTAWVLQAFAAARAVPGQGARTYLLRLRRPDGSFRYSARYATTPLWVTAEVLPALAGKPFPLQ
jgi:prenyltransferase beta subunit